jgi:hypothetical protein
MHTVTDELYWAALVEKLLNVRWRHATLFDLLCFMYMVQAGKLKLLSRLRKA